jgi:hypothetical protein
MQPAVAPCSCGSQVVLRAGAPVRGFHPVDFIGQLPFRWIGPYPAAAIYVGPIAPDVKRFQLILIHPPFAELESHLEVLTNNAVTGFQQVAPPNEITAVSPKAMSLQFELNGSPEQSPPVSCIELRLRRTVPEPKRNGAPRLVGLAVHAVHFL